MPRMGDLAATDVYSAFDVPLDQGTNVGWANRMGEILTTRPQYDETVQYTTASPLVQITEGDIGRATEAALGGMTVTPKSIRAYHSSPHDFDKFDLAKIGTGEGAQVYGHGLYFAESPAVSGQGGEYWKQFAPRFEGAERSAASRLQEAGFDREKAIALAQRDIEAANAKMKGWSESQRALSLPQRVINSQEAQIALLRGDKPVGPRTYEVNINADPAHMLDWDKPLSQQSERVRAAIPDIVKSEEMYRARYPHSPMADPFGSNIYSKVGATGGLRIPEAKAQASEFLREAGIPGIKYLDQGSRGAAKQADELLKIYETPERVREVAQQAVARGEDADYWQSILRGLGDRSHNYVIFDPGIIDIMKKYGIAGAAPVGMGALAAQDRYE